MIKRPKLKFVSTELSPTAIEDIWLRRATAVAIDAVRDTVRAGAVPPMTPVGRLSDVEWGWIVTAVLFGWIKTRAEQATNSGVDPEQTIRSVNIEPDPWSAGAIEAILPELADGNSVDWGKPLDALSRDEMVAFLSDALALINGATIARDRGLKLPSMYAPDARATARELRQRGMSYRKINEHLAAASVTEKGGEPSAPGYEIPGDLSIPTFLAREEQEEIDGVRNSEG
jgi:hypothetical protein